MSSVKEALVSTVEASAPRRDLVRLRVRVSLDMLLTLGITVLAIGLAVGYQVLRRVDPSRFTGSR